MCVCVCVCVCVCYICRICLDLFYLFRLSQSTKYLRIKDEEDDIDVNSVISGERL